ncbi:unnamed protein product [Dovyalis caffra]|uniref:Uncharacterized protein n=1 Tax=Dovyalis caffra TaxID=77055 RepID=A0AAV1SF52_9ROSI|nr:unnamed protein product [Dovyalis caffra]
MGDGDDDMGDDGEEDEDDDEGEDEDIAKDGAWYDVSCDTDVWTRCIHGDEEGTVMVGGSMMVGRDGCPSCCNCTSDRGTSSCCGMCGVPTTNASTERRSRNSGVRENQPSDDPLSNDGRVVVDGDNTNDRASRTSARKRQLSYPLSARSNR